MSRQPQERRLCPGKVIDFALYLDESLAQMQEYSSSLNAPVN